MSEADPHRRPRARFHGRVEGSTHMCDHPDCLEPGEFRAPPDTSAPGASFDGPGEYRWFCLEHIRQFNEGYNFFEGMDTDEIYSAQRPMSGWESETRAFARNGSPPPRWADFSDPLDAIGARFRDNLNVRKSAMKDGRPLSDNDRKALKTLGLGAEADRKAIRRAYSALVRRYHPDRNGGDRSHEKALAKVIAAYTHLKKAPAFAA